jgi:glycosyltransferase involved in cell wall biosynthesis
MSRVVLAANNGEVGGGEVMLLATARVLRDLGREVLVVGPDAEDGVVDRAEEAGMPVQRLAAERRRYVTALRQWDAGGDLLWCHGLVPALATAGRRGRIVHLHQLPGVVHRAVVVAARRGALATLVPSRWLAARVRGARVLPNWTPDPRVLAPALPVSGPRRLGYLGRHSVDKGLLVLAEALARLEAPGRVRLVLAGAPRFVDEDVADQVREGLEPLGDRVERLGWVDPADLLGRVDGLVVPSVAPESFGLAAAEAMAAGVPCLVSDAGALPEVVGGRHPWVVPAGDPDALAAAIDAWAAAPAGQLAAVGRAERARWAAELSEEAARPRVAAVLEAVGAGGGR